MNNTLTINTEAGLEKMTEKVGRVLHVLSENSPALLTVSKSFSFFGENKNELTPFAYPYDDPWDLKVDLLATLKHHNALGLAAIQCAIPSRVFALATGDVCFNPKIISVDGEEVRMKEGCLSFPGLLLPITRPNNVVMSWQDANGNPREGKFSGLTARCILHEYDHLDGIIFTSHVGNLTLQMAKKKRQKLVKKIGRYYEAKQKLTIRTS